MQINWHVKFSSTLSNNTFPFSLCVSGKWSLKREWPKPHFFQIPLYEIGQNFAWGGCELSRKMFPHFFFFKNLRCYDAALLKNVYHANCTKNSAGHLSKSSLSKLHFPMLFSISDSALTQLFFCQPRSKKENLLRQAVQSWKAGVWHEISEAKDERKARKSDSLRTKQCLLKFDTPLSSSTSTAEFSRSIR